MHRIPPSNDGARRPCMANVGSSMLAIMHAGKYDSISNRIPPKRPPKHFHPCIPLLREHCTDSENTTHAECLNALPPEAGCSLRQVTRYRGQNSRGRSGENLLHASHPFAPQVILQLHLRVMMTSGLRGVSPARETQTSSVSQQINSAAAHDRPELRSMDIIERAAASHRFRRARRWQGGQHRGN